MEEREVMGVEELRARLAALDPELSNARAKRLADGLVAIIRDALVAGRAVVLPGLGSWSVVQRAARTGTGPDGRAYTVAARPGVKFRAARALSERLR